VPRKVAKSKAVRRVVTAAATAAAGAIAAGRGEAFDDPEADYEAESELDEDDFGGPMPSPTVATAPPAPPRPQIATRPAEKPEPPSKVLLELADKMANAKDTLEAATYLFHAVIASGAEALRDGQISAAARRKELRTIAAAADKLQPDARRFEAEQTIKRHRAELDSRRASKKGATMEPRPVGNGPK
jgi:hypothetical protein